MASRSCASQSASAGNFLNKSPSKSRSTTSAQQSGKGQLLPPPTTGTSNRATASEIDRLTALYQQQLARFQAAAPDAAKVVQTDATTPTAAPLAAWTVVANVLLNLDETLTKG